MKRIVLGNEGHIQLCGVVFLLHGLSEHVTVQHRTGGLIH